MDANNIEQILQSTMSAAVGQKLDLLGLYGAGTTEPTGLLNYADINSVPVTTFDYDAILDGISENEQENCYTSNVYITSPVVSNTLAKLKDLQNNYITKPEEVSALRRLVSTNVNDSDLVVGDFSNLYLGIRSGISFESSPIAGDSFSKYAMAFRIVLRADWQVIRPKSFCLCSTNIS
jgi:HK97 family phage major capsid protein